MYNTRICFVSNHVSGESQVLETHVDMMTDHQVIKHFESEGSVHVREVELNHDRSTFVIRQELQHNQLHCVDLISIAPRSQINNMQKARIYMQDEDSGLECEALYPDTWL